MNIDIIKKQINSLKNEKLKIKISLGRNKYEYLEGEIDKIYPNLFVIKTNKGVKTFSYSDIIIRNIVITKFK